MLIVLPSLVSGIGLAFILSGVLVNNQVLSDIFLSVGIGLFWSDFFITMALFRHTVRSIDRRLRRLEGRIYERLPREE
jgi:hypothetical protein